MIQDLHSHTQYSFCGSGHPREVVEAAIAGGIEMLGFSDHSYGVGCQMEKIQYSEDKIKLWIYQRGLDTYLEMLQNLRQLYKDKIDIKCGIEISTAKSSVYCLPKEINISAFDYCLIEQIDNPQSGVKNLFSFANRCGCSQVGIAHTDLFAFLDVKGINKLDFFREMAVNNIFWELNVCSDAQHGYEGHAYVEKFFSDERQQELILKSGVRVSVGFDGHHVREYKPKRIAEYCHRLETIGVPMVFQQL